MWIFKFKMGMATSFTDVYNYKRTSPPLNLYGMFLTLNCIVIQPPDIDF